MVSRRRGPPERLGLRASLVQTARRGRRKRSRLPHLPGRSTWKAAGARASARFCRVGQGAHPDRRAGAGHQSSRKRQALHRRVRRQAAFLARRFLRRILRPREFRDTAYGLLFSRAGRTRRRSAAAARMRARLAIGDGRRDAADRACPRHRSLRPSLASRCFASGFLDRDRSGLAWDLLRGLGAAHPAAAAPVMAQYGLAEAESVV